MIGPLIQEGTLDDLVDTNPQEDAVNKKFVDKKFAKFKISRGGTGVLVYLMRVRKFMGLLDVTHKARVEVNFVYDNKISSDGLRTSSYFGVYDNRRYVFGVYLGDLKELEPRFRSAGFSAVDVEDERGFQALYFMSRRQKKLEMPLKTVQFGKVMTRLIGALTIDEESIEDQS